MKLVARDHNGKLYSSLKSMYRNYADRVEYSTMLHRLSNGWTIEEVINGRQKQGKRIKYKRIEYRSISSLCKQFGINCSTVIRALKSGKTIGNIIRMEIEKYNKKLAEYYQRNDALLSTMDDWHKRRYRGIGGSEIASVMGLNKYQSPYDLWCVKTFRTDPFSGNDMTEFGTVMEDYVAKRYAEITGYTVEKDNTHYNGNDVDAPQLVGNIDRLVTLPDGSKRILECKTAKDPSQSDMLDSKSWGDGNVYYNGKQISSDDRIPTNYYLQVQQYMLITGVHSADLCVLFRTDCSVRVYSIPFNQEICSQIIASSRKFWIAVLDDTAPKMEVRDLTKVNNTSGAKEIDSVELSLISKLRNIKEQINELEKEKEELEFKLKETFSIYDTLTVDNQPVATWKVQSRKGLDAKKLKNERPDIYNQFVKETTTRVLRLKGDKNDRI